MIECVLQQQAVQRVGVGKSKVRETLKAERVLLQTPLSVFKAIQPFLSLYYYWWFI